MSGVFDNDGRPHIQKHLTLEKLMFYVNAIAENMDELDDIKLKIVAGEDKVEIQADFTYPKKSKITSDVEEARIEAITLMEQRIKSLK